ncbi:MAG: glucose-6-phosphate dehydrogenase [Bacteroidetes bacterium]|nr:glucose-6-phosphate dehydrogenase [Bacteroidota bacterium]
MAKPDNHILIIFGASGDLTARKLIPAIYELFTGDFLPEKFAVVGVSRTELSDDDFRKKVLVESPYLSEEDDNVKKQFASNLHYCALDPQEGGQYGKLVEKLAEVDAEIGNLSNYIFYLSTPPSLYPIIPKNLASVGLNDEKDGWRRIIIEKPFGYNLETAQSLNERLKASFHERQIYRIDHYLGKETVQNVLVTRFANSIFEPVWNRNYIHHIEITSAESVGVEKRGGYYDTSGALRDMVQNHLLQVAALVGMEPPTKVDSYHIRNEKLKFFQSIKPYRDDEISNHVIRGQYVESVIKGENINGYRNEPDVDPNSRTETYVAMKFFVDNWRWAGIPFYIRTGKKLPSRVTEVVIHFKHSPYHLFANHKGVSNSHNQLILRVQPSEGIQFKFGMKIPGSGFDVKNVNMDFLYSSLTDAHLPDAYERLLLDCMMGDSTLYARGDSVEAAWEFIDPILKHWENNPDEKIFGYPAGTWGPEHADSLIDGKEFAWRYPCSNLIDDGVFCEL